MLINELNQNLKNLKSLEFEGIITPYFYFLHVLLGRKISITRQKEMYEEINK